MTFNSHINNSEDNDFNFDFLSELPVPNIDDSEWLEIKEDLFCQKCKYYNDNGILPCAVNPEKLYHAYECSDYKMK